MMLSHVPRVCSPRAARATPTWRCRKPLRAPTPQRLMLPQAAQAGNDLASTAQDVHTRAGNLLAELLRAPDPRIRATELADELDADFFAVASAYLSVAHKEGNDEVAENLQRIIKMAMAAKNALLRPEIRLLNDLLECQSDWLKRKQVLNRAAVPDVLHMDDGYFFRLVDRMLDDVQRGGSSQQEIAQWLQEIKKECHTRVNAAAAAAQESG